MNKYKLVLLLAGVYMLGFYSGMHIQKVDALVRAPGENSQPQVSQAAQNTQPSNTNPERVPAQTNPQARPLTQSDILDREILKNEDRRPVSPAAATRDGVTLYSLSSAMRVDIERLEEDVASLKNKVSILENMRLNCPE
jgi:hypothetical protein